MPSVQAGCAAITDHLADIIDGRAGDDVLGQLNARLRSVTDANRCFLGAEEQIVVSSVLRRFPADVTALLERRNPSIRRVHVALLEDLADGTVSYEHDHRQNVRDHGLNRIGDAARLARSSGGDDQIAARWAPAAAMVKACHTSWYEKTFGPSVGHLRPNPIAPTVYRRPPTASRRTGK